jgi:hypothetical protein
MGIRLPLLLSLTTWLAPATHATECIEISQRQSFKTASVVFRGEPVKIEHLNDVEPLEPAAGKLQPQPVSFEDPAVITFKVAETWKGPVIRYLKIFAFANPPFGAGYQFRQGVPYVVYAIDIPNPNWDKLLRVTKGEKVYAIGDCILRVRTDVSQESRRLGRGRKPKD